jgi:hypothetical protein
MLVFRSFMLCTGAWHGAPDVFVRKNLILRHNFMMNTVTFDNKFSQVGNKYRAFCEKRRKRITDDETRAFFVQNLIANPWSWEEYLSSENQYAGLMTLVRLKTYRDIPENLVSRVRSRAEWERASERSTTYWQDAYTYILANTQLIHA